MPDFHLLFPIYANPETVVRPGAPSHVESPLRTMLRPSRAAYNGVGPSRAAPQSATSGPDHPVLEFQVDAHICRGAPLCRSHSTPLPQPLWTADAGSAQCARTSNLRVASQAATREQICLPNQDFNGNPCCPHGGLKESKSALHHRVAASCCLTSRARRGKACVAARVASASVPPL